MSAVRLLESRERCCIKATLNNTTRKTHTSTSLRGDVELVETFTLHGDPPAAAAASTAACPTGAKGRDGSHATRFAAHDPHAATCPATCHRCFPQPAVSAMCMNSSPKITPLLKHIPMKNSFYMNL